jgi:hypothetical protein
MYLLQTLHIEIPNLNSRYEWMTEWLLRNCWMSMIKSESGCLPQRLKPQRPTQCHCASPARYK